MGRPECPDSLNSLSAPSLVTQMTGGGVHAHAIRLPLSWGPKRRIGTIGQVYQESPRSRKGILKRLRASDVGHEYGGAVGQIAEGVANGEAEKAWAGGNRWSPTTKSF